MNATNTIALVLASLAAFALAAPAAAQTQVFGLNVEGDGEAGFRGFAEQPSSDRRAKFEEYRDFPDERPFLYQLNLRFFKPDESYSAEVGGSNWGQRDQEFSLSAGRLGLWESKFDWDQTPHIFSTNGRTAEHEVQDGVWKIPGLRSLNDFNASSRLDDIGVRWDTAKIFFKFSPSPDLDLTAQYTRIRKQGERPFSMLFGANNNPPASRASSGNFLELVEPVEQTVHDFRLGGTLAREKWQLQLNYTLSIFNNDLTRVQFDNPCFRTVAAFGCSAAQRGASQPAIGQSSLPPDNMAHTLSIAGGVNLPLRTRINGNFAWSLWTQNADFLPHTINPLLAGNPNLVLPQNSLNGEVQTFLVNLQATSRPFTLPLTLSGKYRLYAYQDQSDKIFFPAEVYADNGNAAFLAPAVTAHREPFSRHNADFDARYQIVQPVALTLGAGWERWVRSPERAVRESDEFFGKAALDWTLADWLLARLAYRPSIRRDQRYNQNADASSGFYLDRRFDMADRDQHRVDFLLQFTPADTFTVTPTVGLQDSDFVHTPFGITHLTGWSAGVDLTWAPTERLSFSAGYMRELNFEKWHAHTSATNDWISDLNDVFDTFRVGGKAKLIRNVLDWTVDANCGLSVGTVQTRFTPGAGAGASAGRWPASDDALWRLETALKYYFWKNWTASLGYIFESFDKHDWRTDTLTPVTPLAPGYVWLGNDLKNYSAHIVQVTLGYHFK